MSKRAERYHEALHHSGPFQHHHIVTAYEQGEKDAIDRAIEILKYADAGTLFINYFAKKMQEDE